jgi:HAD superfamily hydrolase (TIGR01509 family)
VNLRWRPAAVFFDLDGTLVDTVDTRIRAWLEALAAAGLPTSRERVAPMIGMDGRRLAREVATDHGARPDEHVIDEIDRLAGERHSALNRSPRALPGVRAAADALADLGIRWAIATSSRPEQVAASVGVLALPHAPEVIDASGVVHAKPAPDLLLAAAERLGVAAGACWYVGDSTWDMRAARAAGMAAIAITAGSAVDTDALLGAGADLVLPTLDAFAELVRGLA